MCMWCSPVAPPNGPARTMTPRPCGRSEGSSQSVIHVKVKCWKEGHAEFVVRHAKPMNIIEHLPFRSQWVRVCFLSWMTTCPWQIHGDAGRSKIYQWHPAMKHGDYTLQISVYRWKESPQAGRCCISHCMPASKHRSNTLWYHGIT